MMPLRYPHGGRLGPRGNKARPAGVPEAPKGKSQSDLPFLEAPLRGGGAGAPCPLTSPRSGDGVIHLAV